MPGNKVQILLHGALADPGKTCTFFYHQKESLKSDNGKNPILLLGDFFEFPCAEQSIDELELLSGIEILDRKYLYMILSEARRTVKIGGTFLLRTKELKKIALPFHGLIQKFNGFQSTNPHHFISPEDWEVIENASTSSGLFIEHSVVLKRIDGILPETSDLDPLTAP